MMMSSAFLKFLLFNLILPSVSPREFFDTHLKEKKNLGREKDFSIITILYFNI